MRVSKGIRPASLLRGRGRAIIRPAITTAEAIRAQRFATPAIPDPGRMTVATSTSGPVIWSGIRWT